MLGTSGRGCQRQPMIGRMSTSSAPVEDLRRAVRHALAGDWQAAHVIVQEYEGDATAGWLHAVCHRMEGDLANAGYWYRRSGHPLRPELATSDELAEIEKELAGR